MPSAMRSRSRATRRALVAAGALVACAAVSPFAAGLASASDTTSPDASATSADERIWIEGDHSVPVFDIEQAVTENINVETGMDGDEDGVVDTIRIQVVRPDGAGKFPLIVHASPYFAKGSRSAWETGYYVPRGYAVATVALPGTDFSTGCSDVGADLEVLGSKAIVDWANGRTKGYFTTGGEAKATYLNGKVGMVGVSWDGTIANSVASTGVKGLETIVPVAAISSWYDYTRANGITYYDDHIAFLHEYVSNFDSAFCRTLTPILNTAADDATSSYNDWWGERDYRPDASKIKASVFVVHGLTDENVKTGQFGYWWDELEKYDVPRKLFLHQQAHVEPHYSFGAAYDTPLTEWFDYYLQGVGSDPTDGPQVIKQELDGTWSTGAQWPPAGTKNVKMKLSKPLGKTVGTLNVDGVDTVQKKSAKIVQATPYSSDTIVSNPTQERTDRAVFLSPALDEAIRQAGTAQVKLKVKVDKPLAGFQARVVDYNASGGAYIVSRTMASLNHYKGLDKYTGSLKSGKYYTLKWNIHTDDMVFAEGHRLGLVITAERQNIEGTYTPFTATIKLKKSSFKVPLTDATAAPTGVDTVSRTIGTSVTNILEPKTLAEFMREAVEGTDGSLAR